MVMCPRGAAWNMGEKKKSQTLGQINLPLGNWVTLNSSRLYLDPRANVISSVSAKPSPNYSEGK